MDTDADFKYSAKKLETSTPVTWLIYKTNVIDVSSFLRVHPGGESIMRCGLGRDATALIETYHSASGLSKLDSLISSNAYGLAPLMRVPQNICEMADDGSSLFFNSLRRRIETYVASAGGRERYAMLEIGESILTVAIFYFFFFLRVWSGSYLAAILQGAVLARLGFIMHSGSHCSTSRRSGFNEFFAMCMDLIGASSLVWRYEHNVAHHVTPNVFGQDNDCEVADPLLRLDSRVPHQWWHRFQHIYLLPMICFGLLKWIGSDLVFVYRGRVGNIAFQATRREMAQFVICKMLTLVFAFLLPCYWHGWVFAAVSVLIVYAIAAQYLENVFILNHIQDGLVPPRRAHWAIKQVTGSSNWASGSVAANFFSGGLCHQIEHHLFPAYSRYWYPQFAAITKATCEEYGLPYVNFPTFGIAWIAMMRHIARLGKNEDVSVNNEDVAVAYLQKVKQMKKDQ